MFLIQNLSICGTIKQTKKRIYTKGNLKTENKIIFQALKYIKIKIPQSANSKQL